MARVKVTNTAPSRFSIAVAPRIAPRYVDALPIEGAIDRANGPILLIEGAHDAGTWIVASDTSGRTRLFQTVATLDRNTDLTRPVTFRVDGTDFDATIPNAARILRTPGTARTRAGEMVNDKATATAILALRALGMSEEDAIATVNRAASAATVSDID